MGNITTVNKNNIATERETYSYDHLGQLVSSSKGKSGLYTYIYDNGGNIRSVKLGNTEVKVFA